MTGGAEAVENWRRGLTAAVLVAVLMPPALPHVEASAEPRHSRIRRFLDWLADAPFVAALWMTDKLADPMPQTWADEIREARRELLRKAFPGLLPEDQSRALLPPDDRSHQPPNSGWLRGGAKGSRPG